MSGIRTERRTHASCIYDAFIMSTASPVTPAAASRPAAAERVYIHVKKAVLNRSYEGGTLLTEGSLASVTGVSRTPVREALLRLEAEGLIRLYPKKGALVLAVSAQEISDVVETRLLIEEHAVRKVMAREVGNAPVGTGGPRATSRLLAELDESLQTQRRLAEAGDLTGFAAADRAYHAALVTAAGNHITQHLYEQLRDRQLRMGVAIMHAAPDRVAASVAEHAEILDGLRSGDVERTVASLRCHISRISIRARGET